MNEKVNFTPLSREEVQKKFEYLVRNKAEVVIWEKGKNQKETIFPAQVNSEKHHVAFGKSDKTKSGFLRRNVLVNFSIKGLNFFGKAFVSFNGTLNKSILELSDDFYKCERRSTFRLLTYPIHEVRAVFNLEDNFKNIEKGNLLDFSQKVKKDEDIFNNFISLISEGEPSTNEDQVVFRVYDISVTGLAIVVGELEKQYFEKDQILKNFVINFNDESFTLPKAKVVYLFPYSPNNKKEIEQFKVGVQFLNVPAAIDAKLGKIINQNMKESDIKRVFEDFLT